MFKKILTSSILFLIAIGGFFVSVQDNGITSTSYTNAADGGETTIMSDGKEVDNTLSKTAKPSEIESKWLNETIQLFNAFLGFITVLVSPAIILASWLMSPDWTSGDLFGLRVHMHKMWVIISNIVYFIYAILLIIIALATIFGKDNFNYKAMLPKLALGILMVPFTWWFVQWTISLSAVVTAQVVSIPLEVLGKSTSGNEYLNKKVIPKTYYVTTTEKANGEAEASESSSVDCEGGTGYCTSVREMLETGGGMYSTLMMYAYDVFKLQEVKDIKSTLDGIKTAGQLLNQLVVGAVMFFVFGLLVLALISMLLLRAIKLWMYAIFSPIFTLHFVAGKELFGKGTEGFDIKEFIGLCFLPAIVGIVLSFGLMIVSVIRLPAEDPGKTASCNEAKIKITYDSAVMSDGKINGGCTVITMFGNPSNQIIRGVREDGTKKYTVNVIKVAGLTYIYEGKAKNDAAKTTVDSVNTTRGGLDAAGGIFGTIIIDIIALIFIWMAFMAAKGVTKAVDAAVEPFEAMGKKVGQMAMSAPKYIPIPGTGGQSAASLQRTAELASNKFDSIKREKAEAQAGRLVPWAVEGIVNAKDVEKMKQAIDSIKSSPLENQIDTMSKITGEIQRDRKDTTANFAEIQQNLKTIFKDADESKLKKRFYDKGITDTKDQDALVKFYKGIEMDENERARARSANIRFAGNTKQNTSEGGADGANAKIGFGDVNLILTNINKGSTAEQIAGAIKAAPGSGNLNGKLVEADLIEKFKSINDKLDDTAIKAAINKELPNLLKKSGGGGGGG